MPSMTRLTSTQHAPTAHNNAAICVASRESRGVSKPNGGESFFKKNQPPKTGSTVRPVMQSLLISSWELRLDPDDKQGHVFFKIDVRPCVLPVFAAR